MHVYRNISLCCSFWYPKFCLPLAGRAVILTCLHSPVPLLREFFSEWMFLCRSWSCKWIQSNCYNCTDKSENVLPGSLSGITATYWALAEETRGLLQSWITVTLFGKIPKHWYSYIQNCTNTKIPSGHSISVHNNLRHFIALYSRK